MPSTSASGTWVQFFDVWGYQHAYINFTGAQNVPELDDYNFTLFGSSSPSGAKVGDHIESLVTGPQTWLIVYEDEDYNEKHSDKKKLYFGPNSLVSDLKGQFNMGDNIDSFQMYSSQPSGWPGVSKATNGTVTQLAVVDGEETFSTVASDMEDLVGALINLIPDVGGFLGDLLDIFWPSTTDINAVWEAIQRFVVKAVFTGVESSVMSQIEDEFTGVLNAIKLYLNDGLYNEYDSLCQLLADRAPFFTYNASHPASQYPTQKLPYTSAYFTVALAVYSARWRYFDQIYASAPWYGTEGAQKREAFKQALDALLADATPALKVMAKQAFVEQQAWAQTQLQFNDAEKFLYTQQFVVNVLGWVNLSYMWPCFGSTGQVPIESYVHAVTGPLGGARNVSGGGHEKDAATNDQDVTRILLRSGSRVDCLQIWLDGVQQPMRGTASGSDVCDVTLSVGEYVIAAFGCGGNIDSGSINQIYLRTNLGRQFGGGAPASTQFQSLSPQGVGACLSGFTSALQGSTLNSVSFIWRFETPTTPGFNPIAWLDLPGLTGG
ncbi:jacalin-like lectin [Citreicoccus inhibens]|uniref:jacalin-like lectin n=1 Tax=Citreicoccus inhibens TaxID=2849499 RepID=UPI001EF12A11|nr:hypothetical protein [Citreicoccus inhibens]